MTLRHSAAVSLLILLAAGCGGSHDRVPVVPWRDAVPSVLQERAQPRSAVCRASDLAIVGGGLGFVASPAGATATLTLRNDGTRPCRLEGTPRVRFVGAAKMPAQRQVDAAARPSPFPALAPPLSSLRALRPGATAVVLVDWRNWCVPGAGAVTGPLGAPKTVRLTLPGGGGTLDAEYNAVTACVQPGAPSTITVRPFQPSLLPEGTAWTDKQLSARILRLDGSDGDLRAKRGATLRYLVELSNDSQDTLRFDRCPLVEQLLAPAGRATANELNCNAALPVAPGGVSRFEMRLRVPAAARNGVNGLFWELDPLGAQAPEVVGRVNVSD